MTSDFCTLDTPIYVSRQDVLTDGTVTQLREHNERWQEICE